MKIILAVTGSIACYKSYDVARLLVKSGHDVRVILTSGALEFIKPETYRYLGVQNVYLPTDDFIPAHLNAPATVLHIELAKWADKLVIAPLSANTLSRLTLGLNNDLLVSLYLALGKKPVLLFPAMNTQMWNNSRIKEHVAKLKTESHVSLINPVSGLLACGDIGAGKFPDVEAVVDLIETMNPLKLKEEKIVITAGATAAPLDPVRYMTNPSSGKMGIAIAKAFLSAGYEVTLLAGHNCIPQVDNLKGHPGFELVKAPTTELMRVAALKHFPHAHAYISTGAIADIEFDTVGSKIKKESMGSTLPFHQAADILKEILAVKKPHQKVVSFAAETETTTPVFMEKMKRKPVDLMVGNKVSNGLIGDTEVRGFQESKGDYFFVLGDKVDGPIPLSKNEVGTKLVNWYQGRVTW
ncbi:MAG TPA: bifunctional phosphopantothenoylcysteine decarboxylase/phosphopantothenate--cysteine ligase CoaBC [Bacteriovoracaceae bacterium]|nr:bifunctional phosphopantothenoylcysteine decarboxylase/phosphopantothenate--cysteine ligase CoaBC [Bacteriovoracaceae bacterium]